MKILLLSSLVLAAADPRSAVEKAIPILQKTGPIFFEKTGCIGCHHNSLPAFTMKVARERGFNVDEAIVKRMRDITAHYVDSRRERILQGIAIPGNEDTVSYVLFGLAMDDAPKTEGADAATRYLKLKQQPDGGWSVRGNRPPLESSSVSTTAITVRALRAYDATSRPQIDKARAWLNAAKPESTEDHAMKTMGLVWAFATKAEAVKAAVALLDTQNKDGGWSQIPSLPSDAYATGQALTALYEAGIHTTDPAYKKGVAFLLETQKPDGTWHVVGRTNKFQPYFESGFPHGHDQWISAAATSWAAAALALTEPKR